MNYCSHHLFDDLAFETPSAEGEIQFFGWNMPCVTGIASSLTIPNISGEGIHCFYDTTTSKPLRVSSTLGKAFVAPDLPKAAGFVQTRIKIMTAFINDR